MVKDPVYHVLVTREIPGKTTSIEFNMSKADLIRKIVNPYNNFKDFECEGRYFHPGYVTQILIFRIEERVENIIQIHSIKVEKNSEKWNKVVLEYGSDVKEAEEKDLRLERYDPSFLDDFIFAKHRSLINSIDTINDFSKVMITLVSGFFAAYFALLKFLGIEKVNVEQLPITANILYVPPALFIGCIVLLIVGAKPYIFFGQVDKDKKWSWAALSRIELSEDDRMKTLKEKIQTFRKYTFHTKFLPMLMGMILFLIGLTFTLVIGIQIVIPK